MPSDHKQYIYYQDSQLNQLNQNNQQNRQNLNIQDSHVPHIKATQNLLLLKKKKVRNHKITFHLRIYNLQKPILEHKIDTNSQKSLNKPN